MRPLPTSRALRRCPSPCIAKISHKPSFVSINPYIQCCNAPPTVFITKYFSTTSRYEKRKNRQLYQEEQINNADSSLQDHRAIGTKQSLFLTHPSSPGAPFFQPAGTRIFQKLIAFLRGQYPYFGFREVLTPMIYKDSLWKQSGHWDNYKDDMFAVVGNSLQTLEQEISSSKIDRVQPAGVLNEAEELEKYGLKPMNCPGHCLLFRSQRRSYRDLPIRYAEFSPLHRNEISGALSGLTRVRRFHQDDGHIFCRPSQVAKEIDKSLAFIRMVYETLNLNDYRLVLSTRPATGYIGTIDEWDRAEHQLKMALDNNFNTEWDIKAGEGAFYGPKIDIILRDGQGKEHQTGTIQLDFQLPKRFDLTYESPSPELEAKGEDWKGTDPGAILGKVVPVMVHRAVLGSLERFMALLLEQHKSQLPFWLSPNQMAILTVSDKEHIVAYARTVKEEILGHRSKRLPRRLEAANYEIHIDDSAESIARKIVQAKKTRYNIIGVVGNRNVTGADSGTGHTIDLDVSAQPDQLKTWSLIEQVKPGSRAPRKRDRGVGSSFRGLPGVRLDLSQCRDLIRLLSETYA
ncbi:threonyl-tRNA synthetase [Lecanora helva]